MRSKLSALFVATALVVATGCSWTQKTSNLNGLTSFDGKAVTHYNTTCLAIDLLFQPLVGDASLNGTVGEATKQAKADGKKQARIVQSKSMRWWFVFIPISIVIHPVTSNVALDAM
jgi:hypothetical protein